MNEKVLLVTTLLACSFVAVVVGTLFHHIIESSEILSALYVVGSSLFISGVPLLIFKRFSTRSNLC